MSRIELGAICVLVLGVALYSALDLDAPKQSVEVPDSGPAPERKSRVRPLESTSNGSVAMMPVVKDLVLAAVDQTAPAAQKPLPVEKIDSVYLRLNGNLGVPEDFLVTGLIEEGWSKSGDYLYKHINGSELTATIANGKVAKLALFFPKGLVSPEMATAVDYVLGRSLPPPFYLDTLEQGQKHAGEVQHSKLGRLRYEAGPSVSGGSQFIVELESD